MWLVKLLQYESLGLPGLFVEYSGKVRDVCRWVSQSFFLRDSPVQSVRCGHVQIKKWLYPQSGKQTATFWQTVQSTDFYTAPVSTKLWWFLLHVLWYKCRVPKLTRHFSGAAVLPYCQARRNSRLRHSGINLLLADRTAWQEKAAGTWSALSIKSRKRQFHCVFLRNIQ